jgi:hypothetical protein
MPFDDQLKAHIASSRAERREPATDPELDYRRGDRQGQPERPATGKVDQAGGLDSRDPHQLLESDLGSAKQDDKRMTRAQERLGDCALRGSFVGPGRPVVRGKRSG